MRKLVSTGLIVMLAAGAGATRIAVAQTAQEGATISGSAFKTDLQPVSSGTVRLRSMDTARIVANATTTETGRYAFESVQPGNYILELVDVNAQIVGMTPPFAVKDNSPLTISIVDSASGALAAAGTTAGLSVLGLGPTTSLAVLGAAGAAAVTAVVSTRPDPSPSR